MRTCLASECLDKNLHSSEQSGQYVKSGLPYDVVVRQRAAVLELLAREDKALLIWRNPARGQLVTGYDPRRRILLTLPHPGSCA